MMGRASEEKRAALTFEIFVAGFALLALLLAQAMLSAAIHGTNFGGGDGKMTQAIVIAAQRLGGVFHFNTVNPIAGVGSQLLPMNVWINPAYWPFFFFDKRLASDLSATVALGVFVVACYAMVRSFDIPILPSVVMAQLCIMLFAPILFLLDLSSIFSLLVGNAVVYAPYMVALGLLARIEPGSWQRFGLITVCVFALLFYSLCCDPLWSTVNGWSWALPFALVALSRLTSKAILMRCGALLGCVILLILSGAAEYVLSLVRYTARVQFPHVSDRIRAPDAMASILFYSFFIKYFYSLCILGWGMGLLTLAGRPRVLVTVGMLTFGAYGLEVLVYLLLQNAAWSYPLPGYTEQCLFPLFLTSAAAGYYGALRAATTFVGPLVRTLVPWPVHLSSGGPLQVRRLLPLLAGLAVAAIVPATAMNYALRHSAPFVELYNEPWPNEPELVHFLSQNIGVSVGHPFRGTALFWAHSYSIHLTIANLWVHSVPTTSEYDQLVTAQSMYFNHMVLGDDLRSSNNQFLPQIGASSETFWKVIQMLGTRYFLVGDKLDYNNEDKAELPWMQRGYPEVSMPRGAHHGEGLKAIWRVYELPKPNLGDYSPTQVVTAQTGGAAAAIMARPEFDFSKTVVLSTSLDTVLVPARGIKTTLIRGGLHVSGHSAGTSLIILPRQFSHCLRALDNSVRLLRADLLMTGLIFSGEINTDVVFDYGIMSPSCRRGDIADIKQLELKIDSRSVPLSGDSLYPSWHNAVSMLLTAAATVK
jgi:hypothetical protein